MPKDLAKLQRVISAALDDAFCGALAQNQQSPKDIPIIEFKKPSFFNSGCCAFLDGDITGLEFSEGDLRLVRWPDDEGAPKPKVLAKAKLKDVFAAC